MDRVRVRQLLWAGIVANIVLAFLKAYSGFTGHSQALIADAMESTGDVFASVLVLIGLSFAAQPADKNHPYGHGKAEALFTFVVVVFLVTGALVIAYQSILNIRTPHELPSAYTLWVLAITIVVKEVFFRVVRSAGKKMDSTLMKSDAWHHRSDAITSLAAFVGILLAIWLGKGYEAADDWAALLACCIILYTAYTLFRPALGEIMDEHVYDEMVEAIRNAAHNVSGVRGTEKCHVRKSGDSYFADLHINVDPDISVRDGHTIAHSVESACRKINSKLSVIIHVEPHEPDL